jgi:hypothetical protein
MTDGVTTSFAPTDAHRRRVRAGLAATAVALTAVVAGLCGITPAAIFQPGGCPDSSPRPIASSVEPVLGSIDDAELVAGGPRSVEALFDDRARGDALLQQATAHGATGGWTEAWAFGDGDTLHADVTTFASNEDASAFGAYEVRQGCPHVIATHDLDGTDVVITQTDRPGGGDGWEAVVVRGDEVVRLFIVSDDQVTSLERLAAGVRSVRSS